MKKKITDFITNKKAVVGIAAAALAVVIGAAALWQSFPAVSEDELPVITDADIQASVSITGDDTPLGSTPKTTTKTTKKTTKKKVKMAKAAAKTYTKTLPTTTKKSTQTTKSKTQTVKKVTTVKTAKKEKYTKKSKVKVVTTTVTTTVKTTTTAVAASKPVVVSAKKGKYEVNVNSLAPKMDKRVLSAYSTMGFKVYVDSSVSYAGYFNARERSITLREESDNLYHELGHFLAFISGNTDMGSEFAAIYKQESPHYTGYNKAYVTQSASEYFAESTRDYFLYKADLKATRPNTYAALEKALSKVTDAQIAKLMKMYAAIWK